MNQIETKIYGDYTIIPCIVFYDDSELEIGSDMRVTCTSIFQK